MLVLSPRWLFVYPGAALLLAGSLIGAPLLFGPIHLGPVELDVHTLMYCVSATLLGFQAVAFGLLSRTFAENEGLVPADPILARLQGALSVELGLVVGIVLFVFGVLNAALAVRFWGTTGFGPLQPDDLLRSVILSTAAMALGGELVLLSFFLGTLRLARRRTA